MKGPVFIHYILNKMTNSSTEIKEEQINEKSGQKKRNKKVWFGIGAAVVVVGFIGAKTVFLQKKLNLNTQRIPLQKWPH